MLKSAHVYYRDYKETLKMRKYFAVAAAAAMVPLAANANPYASGVTISGTTVSFILNESADSLTYSINGGGPIALDGSTKGTKTFNLTSPTDTFSISTAKNDPLGYQIRTGATTPAAGSGLSQTTNNGGFNPISSDANVLNKFNSPRGVATNMNPNAGAFFGMVYVANSAAGSPSGRGAIGDGLYALKADGTDGTGNGNTVGAVAPTWGASSSAPFRLSVGGDNNVYVADFGDASSTVGYDSPNLSSYTQVLKDVGGTPPLPAGQNHGSTTAIAATGSLAQGNLVIYTLDEDLSPSQFGGSSTARNNLWRYDVGSGPLTYGGTPTLINQGTYLLNDATSDFDIGKDGKFYLAQNRSAGNEAGLFVLDSSGNKIYDSLTATGSSPDILRNILGMAVSPDQHFIGLMLNNSDVAIVPLVDGIPDLANRLIVDTGADVNSGRDIAFDAADNLYYVSSGQGLLRILSPGGMQNTMLTWDGSNYTFEAYVPEPGALSLLAIGAIPLLQRRRRLRA
jgi:hypothetical protein